MRASMRSSRFHAMAFLLCSREVQEKGHFDVLKEFDDLKGKLDGIRDLPDGSGPIYFVKDFGDTAALMLTVASPRVGADEIACACG